MTGIEKALALVGLGLFVFPCGEDKRPIAAAAPHGHLDASNDPDQIKVWWASHPDAFVGVAAGPSGLVVADVDVDSEKSVNGWESLSLEGRAPLPPTHSYKTRRGGEHHVYAAPEGIMLDGKANVDGMSGVDRRGGSSYFIWWGDDVPKSCKAFKAESPAWLVTPAAPKLTDRNADASIEEWRKRATHRAPTKRAKKAAKRVQRTDTSHEDMHAAVGDVIADGTPAMLDAMRERYVADWPEYASAFDNSVRDQVKKKPLPSVTLPFSKAERTAIDRRNSPEGIAEAAKQRKAARVAATKTTTPGERVLEDGPLAEELAPTLATTWAEEPSHGLMRFNGKAWKPADEQLLVDDVRLLLVGIEAEEHAAAAVRPDNKRMDKARTLLSRHRALNVAKLVRGILAKFEPEFDANPDLLNTANGVVNLKTGDLLPHDPAYYLMDIAGAKYVLGAKHPDIDALLKALPREERRWMQIRFGQAATGYQPDDTAVCVLEGGGSNSKSALLNAVKSALGSYVRVAPEKLLLPGRGDHPTELASIAGARVVYVEELPEGRHINAKRVKDLAGTGTLTARRMYRDNFEFTPKHATFISTNYTPQLSEVDEGTWRRFERVVFPYKYVDSPAAPHERQKDRGLVGRVLRGHGGRSEAMLAWIVEGARLWYENGQEIPAPPASIAQAKIEWRSQTDLVMAFASERLAFSADESTTSKALAEAFTSWLFNNGHPAWSHQTISARLESHDLFVRSQVRLDRPYIDGKRTRAWVGVGLVPNEAVLDSFVSSSRSK